LHAEKNTTYLHVRHPVLTLGLLVRGLLDLTAKLIGTQPGPEIVFCSGDVGVEEFDIGEDWADILKGRYHGSTSDSRTVFEVLNRLNNILGGNVRSSIPANVKQFQRPI